MRDDDEAAQPEEVRAAVSLRVEAVAKPSRSRPDQQAAELAERGGRDLSAEPLQQDRDRPFERLQADVAREAVGDDDVSRLDEQLAALAVAGEVQLALHEQAVCFERELVPPLP